MQSNDKRQGKLAKAFTINAGSNGIEDILQNKISIYPNPSKGRVNISINNISVNNLKVEITNTNGQLIYSNNLNSSGIKQGIDLTGKAKGVYFIKISNPDFVKTKKIIIE